MMENKEKGIIQAIMTLKKNIAIVGVVGTGKTTLQKEILTSMPEDVISDYVALDELGGVQEADSAVYDEDTPYIVTLQANKDGKVDNLLDLGIVIDYVVWLIPNPGKGGTIQSIIELNPNGSAYVYSK